MTKVLLLTLLVFCNSGISAATARLDTILMGSAFSVVLVHINDSSANAILRKGVDEIIRIEKMISSWDPESITSRINDGAGIERVNVTKEFMALLYRCKRISHISGGAFDITYAALDGLWKFDGSGSIPDSGQVEERVKLIGVERIELDQLASTVHLPFKGMKIGFGAIGKGFAAQRAMTVMRKYGCRSGVVNAGGDIVSWGKKEDGSPWNIGVLDPKEQNKMAAVLEADNISVVTSGNYEKYIEIDGKRYTHILNPRTGWPVRGISSVTIISSNAEMGDALATAVFVIGKNEGLALINKLQGVHAMIITEDGKTHFTEKLKLHLE